MTSPASSAATGAPARSSGALPDLIVVVAGEQRHLSIDHTPFTIGRKTDKNLVIADPRVSRDHAEIISENGDFFLVDAGSRHGTYVNGEKISRQRLTADDRVEFGARGGPYIIFNPTTTHTSTAREFLSQISGIAVPGATSDLEKLTLFLEAARKLNTTGVVDDILVTLLEATLRLTGAERGYVFLREEDGSLRLAAGRSSKGEAMVDDKTISRSILEEAAQGVSDFLVTDTTKSEELSTRKSIIAYDLRTVIAIPLRRTAVGAAGKEAGKEISGVLYLDSRYASRDLSTVGKDLLGAIATEAAALVENARLVQAEEASRRYQQELSIAASIQQRLMAVNIPDVSFAGIRAHNIACKDIGGDFYDVVPTDNGVALVITDVCGKGVSAALLASIMQGMIYSHLCSNVAPAHIASTTNRFLCQKALGEKYATVIIAHLKADGELEFVNCGHVQPLLVSEGRVMRMEESNVPVGLLAEAGYEPGKRKLKKGDRLIFVTDGVTEAESPEGEFFGDERLEKAATSDNAFDTIFTAVREFCAGRPLGDDCTVFEITYRG